MSSSKITRVSRIQGTLLGLAWGDVFGCPVEGWRSGQIRETYGHYESLPDEYDFQLLSLRGKKVLKKIRPLGLHSDDTQQAMALLACCMGEGGWSLQKWSTYLVEGMRTGAWRGYGRNFTAAVHKLKKGSVPEQAGSESAGMGAAMRIAPLGGLYADESESLAQVVMESCLVTHGDIRAGSLAYAVAWTAAAFVRGEDVEQIIAQLPDAVEAVEREWLEGRADWTIERGAGHLVSETIRKAFEKKLNSAQDIQQCVHRLAKPHLAKGFVKAHPNQGFVLLGGLHGLLMAILGGDDPQRILGQIVRLGYDTDTVAAICGGILGARFGSEWIPVSRFLDRERIEVYAEAIVSGDAPEEMEVFMEKEAAWSKREDDFQAELLRTYL